MELENGPHPNFIPKKCEQPPNDNSPPPNPADSSPKPVCVVKPFQADEKPKVPQQETQEKQTESSPSKWFSDNAWEIAAGVTAATVAVGAAVAMSRRKKNDDKHPRKN